MKPTPIIIDCDPGVDDAMAIMMAASFDELDIKAICSVSGNVELKYTTHNARLVAGLLGLTCPVASGADHPLIKERKTASKTHGVDGFGGNAVFFDESRLVPLYSTDAVGLMAKLLRESPEKMTIVAIGPLTNIATLLVCYPELKGRIEKFSIMGGSLYDGNVTANAEFNFWVDPHAARIVFDSGVPIIMAGLDVTLQAYLTPEDIERMRGVGGELAQTAANILAAYAAEDSALHDPVSIFALTRVDMMGMKAMHVGVEAKSGSCEAMSYTDIRKKGHLPENCQVILEIDRKRFIDEIVAGLRRLKAKTSA
ncbi:MAG: nucleoside hydrolase [Anaerolineaceae bacterium]|nr:nucleoside hydrolase [Anaerolineaceae bacterium]